VTNSKDGRQDTGSVPEHLRSGRRLSPFPSLSSSSSTHPRPLALSHFLQDALRALTSTSTQNKKKYSFPSSFSKSGSAKTSPEGATFSIQKQSYAQSLAMMHNVQFSSFTLNAPLVPIPQSASCLLPWKIRRPFLNRRCSLILASYGSVVTRHNSIDWF
jgi:hypothetical protein